jgi:hypothetical protein
MGQQPGSTRRLSEGRAGQGDGRGIVLSHDKIVAGIAYHLIDLKRANGVDDDGMKKTARRLERKGFKAYIGRGEWEGMNDSQRLDWLLAVSETMYVLQADRVAVLGKRQS